MACTVSPISFSPPVAVVFLFHTVETEKSPWTYGHRYITPFSIFKKQILFIKKHFDIESSSILVNKLKEDALTCNLAAIHFDDGFSSYADLALPFLKRYGIPSTMFLTDSVVHGDIPIRNKIAYCLNIGGKDRLLKSLQPLINQKEGARINLTTMRPSQFLSWIKNYITEEMEYIINDIFSSYKTRYVGNCPFLNEKTVQNLKNDPYVEIGSHTINHPMLSSLKEDGQRKEILQGHNNLERLLSLSLRYFAYPYGSAAHFNNITRHIIEENPKLIAFSSYGGVNYEFDRTDVKRITLAEHSPVDIKVSVLKHVSKYRSAYSWLKKVCG